MLLAGSGEDGSNRHFNSSARWAARMGREVVAARRRAAHHRSPPTDERHSQTDPQQREAHPATTNHGSDADCRRPGGSNRRPCRSPALITGLVAPRTKDPRSTASRSPWVRAPSMRPRESEGKAEGLDEDDEGGVRSEGSGPQSWAIVPTVTAASGDLRRLSRHEDRRPTKNLAPRKSTSHKEPDAASKKMGHTGNRPNQSSPARPTLTSH